MEHFEHSILLIFTFLLVFLIFIGEQTFDDIFHQHNDVNKIPSFNESIVSQHLTPLENSDISYNGSVKYSIWSLLLCSGKCSKVRRRKGEERWITRVVRQRISKWIDGIFSNREN